MSAQLTDEEALNRVASYCSTAEHCRAEINEKLQRWGIAYDTIAVSYTHLDVYKRQYLAFVCPLIVNV